MAVEDAFNIAGRGVVVTGHIERGLIKTGDAVEVVGLSDKIIRSTINSIELFNRDVTEGKKGENVGLLLKGVELSQIKRGMVICKPGSEKPYTEFRASITLKTKEEGGRSTPVSSGYRPQFVFRSAVVAGVVTFPLNKEDLKPGESLEVSVILSEPVALEDKFNFIIKEGSRTVGTGTISGLFK